MTITDKEIEAFLEHHGVKGMKWGVRKNRTPKTQEEKSARNKKLAKVAAVSALAGGGAFVAYKMKTSGSRKISTISQRESVKSAKDLLDKAHNKDPFSPKKIKTSGSPAVKKAMADIISGNGQKKLVDIEADMTKRSNEINGLLKTWYNESNTPIPDRWYAGK